MKLKILIITICNMLICNFVISQSINLTLGSSGVFKVKDASTDYLSLNQSNGYLTLNRSLVLPNTTSSTVGVIYKGAERFIHNLGFANTFVGNNSGNFSMTGFNNTALGSYSLNSISTGSNNTAVGSSSLLFNTTGYDNTAIGTEALISNFAGNNNTAVGKESMRNNHGSFNTSVGSASLYNNISGDYNTAIGYYSLNVNNGGYNNTAIGSYSLRSNINGSQNSALGETSLYSNVSGTQNTAVGFASLFSNISNTGNTAVGWNSLYLSTGWNNTAVGHHSLNSNTTGNYNTALGYNAGSTVTTGLNLTLIGIDANPTSGTANDQITLGNGFISSLRCNVQTITSLSDARDKKNITELSLGLDFITKLHPRQFNWDKREWYDDNVSDGSKMKEAPTAGFIAQELDEVQTGENADWLNLVLKDNPEKWEATYGNLLPVMVKAIQELKTENDELKNKLAKFEEMQSMMAVEIEKMRSNKNNVKEIKLGEK